MGHNGLNTISELISANSSSPMDPLNRIPPYDRVLPDRETAGGSRRGVPDSGAAEERAADEIPVDELIRELELDLNGDLIEDDSVDGAPRPQQSDSPGASENDYATVGVRNLEWRLPVIRSAAHRSADAIASSRLVEPSEAQEVQLTKIVLSTYRLIDPRFRGSYFQQVRVGRTLPMVLQTASCVDGTPLSLQPTFGHDLSSCLRLFGHAIPLTVSTPEAAIHRRARSDASIDLRSLRERSALPTRNRKVPSGSNFRTEAIEVLAELQSRSHPAEWTLWFRGTRLIATLTTVACILVAIVAVYRTAIPLRTPDATPRVTKHSRVNTSSQQSLSRKSTPIQPSPRPLPAVSRPAAVPAPAPETTLPDEPISRSPGPDRTVREMDTSPAVIAPEREKPELTTAELMLALSRINDTPDIDPLELNLPGRSKQVLTVDPPSISQPRVADIAAVASSLGVSTPLQLDEPKLPREKSAAPLDEGAVASAVLTLWSETESAARKFTDASAAELIAGWDLVADLSVDGSAEYLAAKRLARQASWLIHPAARIVAQLRHTDPMVSPRFVNATEVELQSTSNLNADEVERLLRSWHAARVRVVQTSDLNQMLRQANVLLDRIIISDQLSPRERTDFLASFRNSVEKLARICSEHEVTAETAILFTAIDTLPAASEWARLESAEHPSGLMASMYCLQQRRWDQGIAWLGQTGNPAVAAVAKAEWKLIQSEQLTAASDSTDAAARATLASRWSKIADRLDPREAAAVRSHAIGLYGVEPETETQRIELRSQLPKYLQ